MFVREADLAVQPRPAPRPVPTSTTPCSSRRCSRPDADAAWVGWGFVAEDPAFAELCARIGVTFIGPSPEAMRKLGDKIGSKLIAEEVGVPVAPWSGGAVDTLEDAKRRGRADRLPADAQGDRRRRRARHPHGRLRRRPRRRLRAHPRRGAARLRQRRRLPRAAGHRRPPRRGPGHRRRPGHRVGARRPRLLGAAPQPEGHRGVRLAGARRRSRPTSSRPAPSGSPSPSATPAPAPSSSSTTRATSSSPSSRSTPGCRSSTRSPRSPPTPTWSSCRSTSPPAAGSTGERPAERGHAIEARLNAEDPDRDFAPVPGPDRAARRCPPGPASASTPVSARATRSRPTSTR